MRLWVDDMRLPPAEDWRHARTSAEALEVLSSSQVVEMSLDHDLGGDDDARRIILWLCENPDYWPPEVRVHSMNPVGREYLVGMVYRYNPHMGGACG